MCPTDTERRHRPRCAERRARKNQIKSNLFASTQAHTSRNNKCKTKWKLNEYNNYKQKVLAGLKGSRTALTWAPKNKQNNYNNKVQKNNVQRYRRWCAIAVANKNPPATSFDFHSLAVSRDNVKRYTTFDIGKLSVIHYYAPALRIGGIKRWSASDACLSDVCLSRTSGLSREQGGLGRLNWHTGSPRHTWLGHHFQRQKVKGQLCRGRGHIVAASRTACIDWHLYQRWW